MREDPNTANMKPGYEVSLSLLQSGKRETALILSCLTHDHENFETCCVLNANHGLWGLSRLLGTKWLLDGGLELILGNRDVKSPARRTSLDNDESTGHMKKAVC